MGSICPLRPSLARRRHARSARRNALRGGPSCGFAGGLVAGLLGALMPGLAAADGPPPPLAPLQQTPLPPALGTPATPAPVVPDGRPPCILRSWEDGRLSEAVGADGGVPLASGGCRHEGFTGTLTTYHRGGGVAAVMPLKDGLLDGVVEIYDELGHVRSRELWQAGQLRPLHKLPLGEPLLAAVPRPEAPRPAMAGPGAPPPDVTTGADLGATSSGSPPQTAGDSGPGFGLDLRLVTNFARNAYDSFTQLGPGLSVLSALSPRFMIELNTQFVSTIRGPEGYGRRDVPITFGLRTLFGSAAGRMYLLAGLGADYAWRSIPGEIPSQPSEHAWFLDAHAGAGLDLRISRYLRLGADFRIGGRFRVDGNPQLKLPDEMGVLQPLLGSQVNLQLCIGLAVVL